MHWNYLRIRYLGVSKMNNKKMLLLALALRRIVYKVDDETLNKIQPDLDEVEQLLLQLYAEIYNQAIDELFNTPLNNKQTYTMAEYYELPSRYDFDEGWDDCYKNFKEIADRLKERFNA